MKPAIALATGILGFALAFSALAQVYRWTDEEGKTHFGDRPPRDREAEDIGDNTQSVNVDGSGQEREKLKRLFAPETAEEKQLRRQREQQALSEQRQRQTRCENAQKELRFIKEERFYLVDEEGNTDNVSETKRQQLVAELTAAIQRHCR